MAQHITIRELGIVCRCIFFAAASLFLQTRCATAQELQIGEEVQTTCSRSQQGILLLFECYSTIAFLEAKTSDVFYCIGDHQVVTKGAVVAKTVATAECALTFQPFSQAGSYIMLDVTKGQLRSLHVSGSSLYPDGIAWIAGTRRHDIQYCSSFSAGLAGTQRRCVAAKFEH